MNILLFIIFFAPCLLCLPTKRTKNDLSCDQYELKRKQCAVDVSQDQCEEKGCCYNESPYTGIPWCFEGIDDVPTSLTLTSGKSCLVEDNLKTECGYKGIEQEECESRDCCYKIADYESVIPFCFKGIKTVENICYSSCESCEIKGNNAEHNCLKCNNNNPVQFSVNNYYNCYQICNHFYYFDIYGNYQCTIKDTCPEDYPILEEKECKKIKIIKNFIEDLINQKDSKEEEIKYYDTILEKIEDIYTSNAYDTFYLDNGNDEIIEIDKLKVILTTSPNQKNNINSNMINIDLGDYEKSLRQFNNLQQDEIIYIKMLEIKQKGMRIPKIEYDFYAKLKKNINSKLSPFNLKENSEDSPMNSFRKTNEIKYFERLKKLNLNSFQINKIYLSIPINNVDNLDKLNTSSDYYNDFCYSATSDDGIDITLTDRKNEYPSKAACQDDCDFDSYNYALKKSKCYCIVKKSSLSFADMKIDKNKLLDNFKNVKNIANLNLLKCVKVLFSKAGILENVGFYLFNAFIIFHTIALILFYSKGIDLLINKIKEIISAKKYLKSKRLVIKEKARKKGKIEEIIKIEFEQKNETEIKNNKIKFIEIKDNNIINDDDNNINYINNKLAEKENKIKLKKRNKNINVYKQIEKGTEIYKNDNTMDINFNSNYIITDDNIKKETENYRKMNDIKKFKLLMDFTDDEMNDLSYNLALQNDKRLYCQYYFSLIKTKYKLLNAFFYNKDYNSKIIKIDLFLFGFALNYTVNGLFFNDATMHNVYENKGSFDVSCRLPIIVYSSFISLFLGALVQMLGLSNDEIIAFKQDKVTNNIEDIGTKLIKKIKIKLVLYFILTYILLIFFWYYISMFDAIYRNTQFLLLKDTLMGFALSLFSPFVIYLFPGIFRIPALANLQNSKKCLYKFSKILAKL